MTTQYVHRVSLLGLKIILCNLPLMSFHLIFKVTIQEACSYETCQNHRFKHTTHRVRILFGELSLSFIIQQFIKAIYNSTDRKQKLS